MHIDPDQRADAVTRDLLHALFTGLMASLEGARANLDSEFLHDLRVATRRIRSVLGQFGEVFAPGPVADFRARFAWLQQMTGPVRDLDVWLLAFAGHRDGLPPPLRPHLEPVRTWLLEQYDAEHARLVAAFDSERFALLVQEWRAFLEAPLPDEVPGVGHPRPIRAVADARIWRLARRARRQARSINAESPPADLHALRKTCKKLRYLMEFFRRLHPEPAIGPPILRLRALLDRLGAFQDLSVQADFLTELARRLHHDADRDAEEQVATETLLAIGALTGQLLERREQVRAGLMHALTEVFEGAQWRDMRALFAPGAHAD